MRLIGCDLHGASNRLRCWIATQTTADARSLPYACRQALRSLVSIRPVAERLLKVPEFGKP